MSFGVAERSFDRQLGVTRNERRETPMLQEQSQWLGGPKYECSGREGRVDISQNERVVALKSAPAVIVRDVHSGWGRLFNVWQQQKTRG